MDCPRCGAPLEERAEGLYEDIFLYACAGRTRHESSGHSMMGERHGTGRGGSMGGGG